MRRAAGLRANRTTHSGTVPLPLAAAAWKPEGPAGFVPISARSVLSVAPLRTATARLILDQIPLGRMVPFLSDTVWTVENRLPAAVQIYDEFYDPSALCVKPHLSYCQYSSARNELLQQ